MEYEFVVSMDIWLMVDYFWRRVPLTDYRYYYPSLIIMCWTDHIPVFSASWPFGNSTI